MERRIRALLPFFGLLATLGVTHQGSPNHLSPSSPGGVPPGANLSLSKTASANPIEAGSTLTYTLNVTNGGPSKATSVTVRDNLPGTVTFVSCSSTGGGVCGGSGANRTVTFKTLSAAASAAITLVVQVKAGTPTGSSIANTASVSSKMSDPDLSDNSATAVVSVGTAADLGLALNASPDPVAIGGQITYAITLSNGGPQAGTAVTLTDTLPQETSFVSCASTGGGTCGGSGRVRSVSFTSLNSGSSAAISLVAEVSSSVADRTVIANTARVSSSTTDPSLGNNSSTALVTAVQPAADLALTLTAGPDPVPAGSDLTLEVQVANRGPSTATSAALATDLPPQSTLVSCTPPPGGTCGAGANGPTVNLAGVSAGTSATVTIVARIPGTMPEGTELVASATRISSSPDDPDSSNDSASAALTVGHQAGINPFRFHMRLQPVAGSYPANMSRFHARPIDLAFAPSGGAEENGAIDEALAKSDPPVWKVLYYDFANRAFRGSSHWDTAWVDNTGATVTAPSSWGVDPLPDHPEWFDRYGGMESPFWMRENAVQGQDKGFPFTLTPVTPAFRTRQARWVAEKSGYHNAHGIFLDMAGPSTLEYAEEWGNEALGPYQTADDAGFTAAAEAYKDDFPASNAGLLRVIESALYPGHDLMFWNVTGSNPTTTDVVRPRGGSKTFEDWVKQDYVGIGDGAQMDGFAWNRSAGAYPEEALLWQLRMARYFIERKKYILLKAPAKDMPPDPDSANDAVDGPEILEAWTYSLACYALVTDGTFAMFWPAHDLERYWDSALVALPLGRGIEVEKQDGDVRRTYRLPGESDNRDGLNYGVLNRAFENGLVLINSAAVTRSVSLPVDGGNPRYKRVTGTPVASVTLPAKTAIFLLRNVP